MLKDVDLSLSLSKEEYEKVLPDRQLTLIRLQQKIRKAGVPVIIMYEGWDASGKGGSILRITEKLDPRGYKVYPIGVPTDVEKSHSYFWRFTIKEPPAGEIAVFDRSWYGRVLVERVEKLAKKEEWKRAYEEIRNFEKYICDNGTLLIKFFMHISKDEQLARFKARESDPFKQWKITEEDWRNRDKWDEYAEATEDMLEQTNVEYAPWQLVPAECKRYARIFTMDKVAEALKDALSVSG